MYNNYPAFYREHFLEHKWAEAIFFGIEHDTISCKLTYFELLTSVNEMPRLDSGLIDLAYQPGHVSLPRAGGHCDSINAHFGDPGIWAKGYQHGIDSLMRIQSNATPDNVAFPISMILITRQKQKWLCACTAKKR
jgi:hypothetical protein